MQASERESEKVNTKEVSSFEQVAGYLGYSPNENAILVSFRGTKSNYIKNWFHVVFIFSFDFDKISFVGTFYKKIKMHQKNPNKLPQ